MLDLIIKNGDCYIDGNLYKKDIGIINNKIVKIGDLKEKSKELKFDEEKLNRQLNVGFSGGEKKKNEILQMSLLDPKLSILDETDSGLDIDALKIVANGKFSKIFFSPSNLLCA